MNDVAFYNYLQLLLLSLTLGGKLAFIGPGPLELHAHSILVSDGGELQIGSPRKPFCDMARIHLHGSTYSEGFFPYGVKFLAVRNGTLSMHGELYRKDFAIKPICLLIIFIVVVNMGQV